MRKLFLSTLVVLLLLSLTANVLLYFRYSDRRPMVTVGGQVIRRGDYEASLDMAAGRATLNRLVFAALVEQAAARSHCAATPQEVADRLASLQRVNPQQYNVLAANPPALQQFKQGLTDTIDLENLRIQHVSVTPQEIQAFYAAHKALFSLPAQVRSSLIVTDNAADAATAATLLRQGVSEDSIAKQPSLHVVGVNGYSPDLATLAPKGLLQKTVFQMHPGDVKTLAVGGKYLTLRITTATPGGPPPLAKILPEVRRAARLQKAPSATSELASLYAANTPTFNMSNYQVYFSGISSAAPAKPSLLKRTASAASRVQMPQ